MGFEELIVRAAGEAAAVDAGNALMAAAAALAAGIIIFIKRHMGAK